MSNQIVYKKSETVILPSSVNHRKVQNDIMVESTKDSKLFRVFDGKIPIGSVRQEKDYWVIYGVFVEEHFVSMEEAIKGLVFHWDWQLARMLEKKENTRPENKYGGKKNG